MKKKTIRLTESDLHRIVKNSVKRIVNEKRNRKRLREGFEDDYNKAMDKHMSKGGMWGMELKNSEDEWEYGNIEYDPVNQTMSCMNATIDVDPDMTVDQNLEALYDELMNQGYYSE